MFFEDDVEEKKPVTGLDFLIESELQSLSIQELDARVAWLEREIERTQAVAALKKAHRSDIENLFSHRTGL